MNKTLLIAALLAGCGGQNVWDKPGTTQQQFQTDLANCEFEGEKAAATVDWRIYNTATVNNRIIESCLRSRGYELRRK